MTRHHTLLATGLAVMTSGALIAGVTPAAGAGRATANLARSAAVSTYRAIWPAAPGTAGFTTPARAARSFAVSLLGMGSPVVGVYSSRTASTGVVSLRPSTRGALTYVHVEHFAGAPGWWVVSCTTSQISLTSPVALARVTSPLRLTGSSIAFEAVLNISVYVDGRPTPIVRSSTMGGGTQMAPFHAALRVGARGHYGTVIVYAKSAKDGATVYATARRIFLT